MDPPLLRHDGALVAGRIVDRPNRFVMRVQFDGDPAQDDVSTTDGNQTAAPEPVHLGDPGVLPTLLARGNEILCSPVEDPDRVTGYDAIAARTGGGTTVGLRATMANELFERALQRDALPAFREYTSITREPPLPDRGRTDFLLEADEGTSAYVEVKSCSLARDGVARFPDRVTARGRRQLRSLERLADDRTACHVVFVVQRSDVRAFRPLAEVDPAFADLLARVAASGVDVRAIVTPFEPPHYRLEDPELPVEFET